MTPRVSIRALEVAARRNQREAQKQLRDLERRAKEQAKLSEMEKARLEVETFDNRLEMLLSVHKEQGENWDWSALAVSMPPPPPQRYARHELNAVQHLALESIAGNEHDTQATLQGARALDDQDFQNALEDHSAKKAEWTRMNRLSRGILAGNLAAYTEALSEFSPLDEITNLGSSIRFTVHTAHTVECALNVNGVQAIPPEIKTLTATGKVSVKTMPRARFNEIYQDYVCACVLRTARELFALLPVHTVLVTACADVLDSSTGQTSARPVLSASIPRRIADQLDYEHLDPSDAVDACLHRGDFKATRKSGAFLPILPITPEEIAEPALERMTCDELLVSARRLRQDLREEIARLDPTQEMRHALDGESQ